MSVYEIAEKTVVEKDGIANNDDFHKNSLRNYQISKLCNEGFLERVRRGYYKLGSYQESGDEKKLPTFIQMAFSAWILPYIIMATAIGHRLSGHSPSRVQFHAHV